MEKSMNISYDYYRVFYYVAKLKSFTAAAQALMNNQPNITRMMKKLEERIKGKLEEPRTRVGVFEAGNWIHFINQNVMSVIRFYSGPVKFTLGWLDRIDMVILQHLAKQGC